MAACAEVISPLAFYGAPKSQLYAVLISKNYFSPHFSFLGSLPVSTAGALEQAEQLPPEQAPPVGQRAAGSGRWPLRSVGDAAAPGSPALASLGSPGVPGWQQEPLGVVCCAEATVPRHVEGREEPAFPPGRGFLRDREGASGTRLGCLALRVLAGAGASAGERLREQQKIDLKVQEVR